MRKLTIAALLVALSLVSCAEEDLTTSGPMSGPETRTRFSAFEEMCARNPESILCNEDAANE